MFELNELDRSTTTVAPGVNVNYNMTIKNMTFFGLETFNEHLYKYKHNYLHTFNHYHAMLSM
jgi:hypothetical protein